MKSYPKWPSTRFTLALLGFIGFTLIYAMRINLSIAIVNMVVEPPKIHSIAQKHQTNLHGWSVCQSSQLLFHKQFYTDEECPVGDELVQKRDPQSRTKKDVKPKPASVQLAQSISRFAWTEHEVSSIMGAFYYGYMFTQIPGGQFTPHKMATDSVFFE